ncbi:WD40-repeat-containing domain protein [Mycena floridula]|nr:WD40-repeat-containing domain protein [Mycena floridula]
MASWSPPKYDIRAIPSLHSRLELTEDDKFPGNFARVAKWSPDGAVLLAQCENRTFQMITPDFGETSGPQPQIRVIPQPAPILDFIWYPTASPSNPGSFCFVSSVRESPVKLLDASDGRLRASYKIVDHRERQIGPHSLAFNLTAQRLYCGFEDAIEVFDVARPGEGQRLPTTPSKKSKDGLKGIISALAFSPSYESELFAAGTLTPAQYNIALFNETEGGIPSCFLGGGPAAAVTQLQFNPTQPHILYAAFRRISAIYSWDLRGDIETPMRIYAYDPKMETELNNQRRRFDVDLGGKCLSIGDQNGQVCIFDLNADPKEGLETDVVLPKLVFKAQNDAIGSVAFHPLQPWLLTAAGSRHFLDDKSEDGTDDEDDHKPLRGAVTKDSSIKIWNLAGT